MYTLAHMYIQTQTHTCAPASTCFGSSFAQVFLFLLSRLSLLPANRSLNMLMNNNYEHPTMRYPVNKYLK